MSGKVTCINPRCCAELKHPNTPFISCPACRTDFLVFCHEFPEVVFEHLQCQKCPSEIYFFYCFKCKGLMNYSKYRMGSVCTCKKCNFSGCYVVCVHCHRAQCFPPTQRYEAITWKCEFCNKPFNFMTCDQCSREVYRDKFYAGQTISCENKKCKVMLQIKKCLGCQFLFADSIGHQYCDPCYEEYIHKTHKSYIPSANTPAINPARNVSYSDVPKQRSNSTMGSQMAPSQIPPPPNPFYVKPPQPPNRNSLQNPELPNYFSTSGPLGPVPLNRTLSQGPSSASTLQYIPASTQSMGSAISKSSRTESQVIKERAKLEMPFKMKEDTVCKICLEKEAEFLNVTCFHMSVCANCVKSMNQQCPVCKAPGGFRRVFV